MKNEDMKTNRSLFPLPSQTPVMQTEYSGLVKVHESVISSIVRRAACSVPGVTRLAENSFVSNLADIVGNSKIFDRVISIEMGDNSVQVDVRIVVAFGCNILETAAAVQQKISSEIYAITGMQAERVKVVVSDLDEVEDFEDGEAAVRSGGSDSADQNERNSETGVCPQLGHLVAAAPANLETPVKNCR